MSNSTVAEGTQECFRISPTASSIFACLSLAAISGTCARKTQRVSIFPNHCSPDFESTSAVVLGKMVNQASHYVRAAHGWRASDLSLVHSSAWRILRQLSPLDVIQLRPGGIHRESPKEAWCQSFCANRRGFGTSVLNTLPSSLAFHHTCWLATSGS